MRLPQKVAVVTGGGSGIGRAICDLFAKEGASLVVADTDAGGGQETLRRIKSAGGQAVFAKTDVSKEPDVANMVQAAVSSFGGIDILVNNAAAFVFRQVEDVTDSDWQRVISVNLMGAAYCTKHVLPAMKARGGGSIVNMGSIGGLTAQPASVPYGVSKSALIQLTRDTARDLSTHEIRVNCVCPGSTMTPAFDRLAQAVAGDRAKVLEDMARNNLMKRIADPMEIAYGVLFLASDESSFVTGASLVMDGGQTI